MTNSRSDDSYLVARLHMLKTAIVLSMKPPASDNWRALINEAIARIEELTTPKPRPTIAELEAILAQPDENVDVLPDGSTRVRVK